MTVLEYQWISMFKPPHQLQSRMAELFKVVLGKVAARHMEGMRRSE
jgi:hypothetical protein